MTAQEIIDEVLGKLRQPNGIKKIRKRRAIVASLADVREHWEGLGAKLVSREAAVFTTDQTGMARANKGFELKLLVRGQHVANLEFPHGDVPRLSVRKRVAEHQIALPPRERLAWSGDVRDGKAIRDFINECVKKLPGAQPELQVQLQLVQRLYRSKKQLEPELANLQPVMPFGFPTELATVVDRVGNPATGNMDILARTVQGRRSDGGAFVVMELKEPNLKSSDVPKAFRQAIGYAAALTVEANDLESTPLGGDAAPYRRLFGPNKKRNAKPPDYVGKPVSVHAVVVLPERLRGTADRELDRLELRTDPPPNVGRRAMSVGVLLYEAVNHETEWKLGHSFSWIDHAGSWRPR
jgi:hypothetical protein